MPGMKWMKDLRGRVLILAKKDSVVALPWLDHGVLPSHVSVQSPRVLFSMPTLKNMLMESS